jgi:glycosyltransferase involved in cell wall biosynthesis
MLRIAYVTAHSVSDIKAWSGLVYYIHKALEASGIQIHTIDKFAGGNSLTSIAKKLLYEKVLLKKYLLGRDPALLRSYATQVERALASLECDLVFSPGTLPIAYLQTDKPIVFWTDASFAGMVDAYPGYTNLSRKSIRCGNETERTALSSCSLAIYSSEWAASTAVQNYGVDPRKIAVVPFGANTDGHRTTGDIARITEAKKFDVCKLLFVGCDWVRKRGDFVLAVTELLNRSGVKTELNIVGCTPFADTADHVKVHGFVSKETEQGRRKLDRLFSESHFLILPSRAECYGLVLAEASSYGLPCVASNVGGISTVIRQGANGVMFSVEEGAHKYCEHIQSVFSSRSDYEKLALSSFQEFSQRLNWAVAGKRVHDLIEKLCNPKTHSHLAVSPGPA